MSRAAAAFQAALAPFASQCRPVLQPEHESPHRLQWHNHVYNGPKFRRAHLEIFNLPDRCQVLHLCIMPHYDDPAPIYGFDMVAGSARVSGIFLDLSPATQDDSAVDLADVLGAHALGRFAEPRILPDWATIFSPGMLAIRPKDTGEVARAIDLAHQALHGWLTLPRAAQPAKRDDIRAGQARYCLAQRRNEHTYRMLAGFVGAQTARAFIDGVLFPVEEEEELLF